MRTGLPGSRKRTEGTSLSKYLPHETERAWVPPGNSVMLVARKHSPDKTCRFGNIIFGFAAVIRERRGLPV